MVNFIHYIWHGDIFWIFIVLGFEHEHELGDYVCIFSSNFALSVFLLTWQFMHQMLQGLPAIYQNAMIYLNRVGELNIEQ